MYFKGPFRDSFSLFRSPFLFFLAGGGTIISFAFVLFTVLDCCSYHPSHTYLMRSQNNSTIRRFASAGRVRWVGGRGLLMHTRHQTVVVGKDSNGRQRSLMLPRILILTEHPDPLIP